MSKVSVMYYISDFGTGGAERQVIELLKRLDRERFRPSVCVSTFWGPLAAQLFHLQEDGIAVYVLPRKRMADLWFLVRLTSLLRQKAVDILHSYIFSANWRGVIAGRLARVPINVASERSIPSAQRRGYRVITRVLIARSDKVIVNSHAGGNWLTRHGLVSNEKVMIIPNGVDMDKFKDGNVRAKKTELGLDPEQPIVGIVAGFRPNKDHETFFRAAATVLQSRRDVRFLCVGENNGNSPAWASDLMSALGLSESVVLLGEQKDIGGLIPVLDIGVLSSAWGEGLPNAVLEYMAAGKPVVATSVAGCPEVILDGETGFLVAPRDHERLAAAIISLLSNPDMAQKMGMTGRDRVAKHFSMKACVDATCRLYEELISEKLRK